MIGGVRERLRGDRVVTVAAAVIGVQVALAVLAPLIASDRPFVLHVPEAAGSTGFGALPTGWSFPWLTGLFDARSFPSIVDRAINGLLVLLPFVGLSLLVAGRRRAGAVFGLWLVLGVAVGVTAAHEEPKRSWVAKVERLRDQGHEVTAVFAPIRHAPDATDVRATQQPPSAAHLLGTDTAGRDVLTRLLFGLRISLSIGLVAVSLYILFGVLLGALAGARRGRVDRWIVRAIEVVSCFPTFLLVMVLIALVRERSIFHVMLVLGLTGWPGVARLVRAEFLSQDSREYAVAARALGLPASRVIFRHVLPNCMAPVLIVATFGLAGAILIESGLAFLGLGDAGVASWGQVLREGRVTGQLHLILAPGLLIFVTVTMMNLLAEGLRDALDPKLHRGV